MPTHVPVLLQETLTHLAPQAGDVVVDCTAGLGGHASEFAKRVAPGGVVILNDLDASNLQHATARVKAAVGGGVRVESLQGNFAGIPHALSKMGLRADVVLADLGFASNHVDTPERGFSFQSDGPLDMRLNQNGRTTAQDLVMSLSEAELAKMIEELGEDRNARRIARRIVQERVKGPITTTGQLADLVRSAVPPAGQTHIHPATKTFQALRIMVNDELGSLGALLSAIERGVQRAGTDAGGWLAPGARVGLISFHSLEDRPIKQCFQQLTGMGGGMGGGVGKGCEDLTDGALAPTEAETNSNPRSRSAKLRGIRLPK